MLHKCSFSTICKQSRSKLSTALIVGFIFSWKHEVYVREYLSVGMVTLRIELRVKSIRNIDIKNVRPDFSPSYQPSSHSPLSSHPFLSQFSFCSPDIPICLLLIRILFLILSFPYFLFRKTTVIFPYH